MPICRPCRNARHDRCDDIVRQPDYRGCPCQHITDRRVIATATTATEKQER